MLTRVYHLLISVYFVLEFVGELQTGIQNVVYFGKLNAFKFHDFLLRY